MMTAKNLSLTRVSRSHSFLFILLLYEAIVKVVISAPSSASVILSENGGPFQTASEIVKHSIVMPVWVRKAGGNWRPELLPNPELANKATPSIAGEDEVVEDGVHKEDTKMEAQTELDTSSPITRTVKEIIDEQKDPNEMEEDLDRQLSKRERNDGSEDEYMYDDDLEPEELECPEDQYYHIRGKRCVPLACPGGNTWRDQDTGECILKRYGHRNRWKNNRPWRPQ